MAAPRSASDSGDHLGSVGLTTRSGGAEVGRQEFDAWGSVRAGSVSQTTRGFTGQYRDDTGLLYYTARYYDPAIGRFISADTVVPGNASGSMDGVAVKPLTVSFHEAPFLTKLSQENGFGFWFELSDEARRQAGSPWGPSNPQALNRYSYVLNNPVRWTDQTGHCIDPVTATLCAIGGAAAVKALVDAIIVTVGIGFIVYNTSQMMAASKDAAATPEGDKEKVENPPWEKLQPYRGKTKTNGLTGKDRRYYERDRTHGDVEVYDSRGNHLGSMDPATGTMTKPPVKGRRIDL